MCQLTKREEEIPDGFRTNIDISIDPLRKWLSKEEILSDGQGQKFFKPVTTDLSLIPLNR